MAGVDYSGFALHVVGGGRAGRSWGGVCSPHGTVSPAVLFGTGCARSAVAYGGAAASVGQCLASGLSGFAGGGEQAGQFSGSVYSPGGVGSTTALVGAGCARSGGAVAYGGASSVGHLLASSCELPGAARSKARLAYCMTLEETGDRLRAMAAGRAEEARSAAALESCRRSGAMGCGAGRRLRRRGVPARRRKASSCTNGEIAPSRSTQHACEETSSLRQGLQVTSISHTSRAGYSTPRAPRRGTIRTPCPP